MKRIVLLIAIMVVAASAQDTNLVIKKDIPYAGSPHERQVLDIYAPPGAKGLPLPEFGHREKFGDDPGKHRDFSAVTHVASGKDIPPFLILHVAAHPDNAAQAQRLGAVLKAAGIPVKVFGARDTDHTKINANLGIEGDPSTGELFAFMRAGLNE